MARVSLEGTGPMLLMRKQIRNHGNPSLDVRKVRYGA